MTTQREHEMSTSAYTRSMRGYTFQPHNADNDDIINVTKHAIH